MGLFTLGVVGAGVVQALDYVTSLLATHPLLGWPFAIFFGMALFALTAFATGEIADMRRLSRRAATRAAADRIAASELHGEAEPLLASLAPQFAERPQLKANVEQFNAQRHDAMSDGELLRLFERQVLAPVDRQAYRLVLQSSRDIGLLTALSPLGLLDGVLLLWRTSILFRSVARLYGMAPGPTVTVSLLKGSIRNAALPGWPTWSPTPRSRASAPACSRCSPRAPARVPATPCSMPGSASRRSASAGLCPSWPRSRRGWPTSASRCSRAIAKPQA